MGGRTKAEWKRDRGSRREEVGVAAVVVAVVAAEKSRRELWNKRRDKNAVRMQAGELLEYRSYTARNGRQGYG